METDSIASAREEDVLGAPEEESKIANQKWRKKNY